MTAVASMAGVPSSLALAVAMAESGGNPSAYNKSSGATGMFQLLPSTARGMGLDAGKLADNIAGGVIYLRNQLQKYHGNVVQALAAYNWGPGAVDGWIARGANFAALPAETQDYIRKILAMMERL